MNRHLMNRSLLAYIVLVFSTISISLLGIYTIRENPDEAKDIFNVVLPVFASWVGTILAFYFGRENLEAANQQVKYLVEKLNPEERAQAPVSTIMRYFVDISTVQIPSSQGLQDITVKQLRDKLDVKISRIPVIDAQRRPLLMIHGSRLDHYIVSDYSENDSLDKFADYWEAKGLSLRLGSGFIVVPQTLSIQKAKQKMDSIKACQDIFVTREGSPNEPLIGWVSNLRIAKYLEV